MVQKSYSISQSFSASGSEFAVVKEKASKIPYQAMILLKSLEKANFGTLSIITPEKFSYAFAGTQRGPQAHWHILNWRFISEVLKKGEIGFFEAYQNGWWDTPDLVNLLHYFLLNERHIDSYLMPKGWKRWIYAVYHQWHRNGYHQARKNIKAHYDLGNDFYRLWLDPQMNYSSAYFADKEDIDLEAAHDQKFDKILETLNLSPGARILEIGCGWGGFCTYAASKGYHVKALTISPAQYTYTRQKIAESNLQNQVDLCLLDYRDANGDYEAIVSIEMFEAVGKEYWPAYFETIKRCLVPGGKALIQTITIQDDHFDSYLKNPDFIQLYVFPGGMLASARLFSHHVRQAGLEVFETMAFGQDYVKTLSAWLQRFEAKLEAIQSLGFDETFIKKWRYYLCYCIAGFLYKRIDVKHFLLQG